jgi:site-specific recombinase XerD
MGRLYNKMNVDLKLLRYSDSTQKAYLRCSRNFVKHFMRPPAQLGEKEIRLFLEHLINNEHASESKQKTYVASLKFLYERTLQRPQEVVNIPWPKVPHPLPDILSGTEVQQLLQAIESQKHRAILMTSYASGLRIFEACKLQCADIDSKRGVIHVRAGKRKKDRYVMLSDRLLAFLRVYYQQTRPPAPFLFPGRNPEKPITSGTVQKVLKRVVEKTGIKKKITTHTLRHSFATHLLEGGTDIRVIQQLLGHGSIRSTQRYTKVSRKHIASVRSPLDVLGSPQGKIHG